MTVHLVTSFFVIWHGDRYGHKVFKNHRKQIELDLRWPVCAKSNTAATRKSECRLQPCEMPFFPWFLVQAINIQDRFDV